MLVQVDCRALPLAAWLLLGAALACARYGPAAAEPTEADDTGSLALALSVPGGLGIRTVSFLVTGAGGVVLAGPGTFSVSDPGAAPSLTLALPPSLGATVALSATSDDGRAFSGTSPPFTVTAGQSTPVNVSLHEVAAAAAPPGIVIADGTIVAHDTPPVISSVVIAPAPAQVGTAVTVKVVAVDLDPGDGLTYAWSAGGGTFADPTAPVTSYRVDTPGTQIVRITVSDTRVPPASTFVDLPVSFVSATDVGAAP